MNSSKVPLENVVVVKEVFDSVDENTCARKLISQIFPANTPVSEIIKWSRNNSYHGNGNLILTVPEGN